MEMSYEPRLTQITKELPYKFNDGEQREIGLELAKEEASLLECESLKKTKMKIFSSELKVISDSIFSLSTKLNNGYEQRDIECEKSIDFQLGTMKITRRDTGEVVEERPLTDEEKQLSLDQ